VSAEKKEAIKQKNRKQQQRSGQLQGRKKRLNPVKYKGEGHAKLLR
jgi:hypothetical protein